MKDQAIAQPVVCRPGSWFRTEIDLQRWSWRGPSRFFGIVDFSRDLGWEVVSRYPYLDQLPAFLLDTHGAHGSPMFPHGRYFLLIRRASVVALEVSAARCQGPEHGAR